MGETTARPRLRRGVVETWKRGIARGATAAGAIVLALPLITLPAAPGCTTHQCDPSTVILGQDESQLGTVTQLDTGEIRWQSNGINDPQWLDFPGMRTYVLYFPQPFESPPEPMFDIRPDASDRDAAFVVGAANLAQFFDVTTTSVSVFNPSCAQYGLRVFATGFPASRAIGSSDAGSDEAMVDSGGDTLSNDSTSE